MNEVAHQGMRATAPPEPTTDSRAEQRALQFTAAMMAMCIIGQRFGLQLGTSAISVVGPLALLLALFCLANGTLAVHRARLAIYLAFIAIALLQVALHAGEPAGQGVNIPSLAQFTLVTSFVLFTFRVPVDEAAFFRLITFALVLVAICGILQFLAQIIRLPLFAFTDVLPNAILIETGWNLSIPIGVGNLLKANGFFLVEPSVFSQFMAVGLMIEVTTTRRLLYIVAFIAGLLLSFSGTGWIVLFSFLLATVVGKGWRGILLTTSVVVILATILALVSVFAPDFFVAATSRSSEITTPGTSGHLRFVTPFWMTHDVFVANPMAWLTGLGSGISERLTLAYDYNVNTPTKVLVEYGLPGLATYLLLITFGKKSPIQMGIVFPCLVLVLFTGGYQQFPPVLYFVLLLTVTARLRKHDPADDLSSVSRDKPGAGGSWATS